MLLVVALACNAVAAEEPEGVNENKWDANKILGSKHDLSQLNVRSGAEAMSGVAYSDYGDACVYCHIPPDVTSGKGKLGQLAGWNRLKPMTKQYQLFRSQSSATQARKPSDVSLLCLSCHDGTLAIDRIAHKPQGWDSGEDFSLHMRMTTDDDLTSCGKCHNGSVAHNITSTTLGIDLRDDHPISIPYAGLDTDNRFFKAVDNPSGFNNGVKLYDGMIECASCHDIHDTETKMLLRVDADVLCSTCHNK